MSFRVERLGELLKRDLGEIIQREFQPDGTFVTVTQVRVTPDLSIAKVYLSVFAPDRDNEVVFEYIDEKVPQIRHKLAVGFVIKFEKFLNSIFMRMIPQTM